MLWAESNPELRRYIYLFNFFKSVYVAASRWGITIRESEIHVDFFFLTNKNKKDEVFQAVGRHYRGSVQSRAPPQIYKLPIPITLHQFS